MKTRFYYLLGIFITFIASAISLVLILNNIDPDVNFKMGSIILIISSFFMLNSFLALCIYFFKKIYYRGEIYIKNINSSLRQGSLIAIFIISCVVFYYIWVFSFMTGFLLFTIIVLIELIFQSFQE
ncbi:MAG: hypothetical protein PHF46_01040 [Candidatus Gracilibacteria bacterium]|nr:hypothetical protein [Candidatus Gracilibacteria bacterium]MDD3119976.1 hypothetical protein [Candidatus Gracilibacteria bacterium]MDD4530082.1 hypothetical protein [Candidatus Gracilibacteria bacterium]